MEKFIGKYPDLWEIYVKQGEYHLDRPDRFFKYDVSLKNFNVLKPTISDFLYINKILNIDYPDDKQFSLCLTHDVDDIYPPYTHTILSLISSLRNPSFHEINRHIFWRIKGNKFSPYRNFNDIINLEKKYGGASTFFFLAANHDIRRFRYDIEEMEYELGNLIDNGCEIGLHGGYNSYNNKKYIKEEKHRLESVISNRIIGYRNHYLRFKTPHTWEILANLGFKYDTTFGYNDYVGFRNGLCYPFKPFNLNINKEINIIEVPLIIMDAALFGLSHSFEDAWELSKKLVDEVEKCKGILTLLWHSYAFASSFRRDWIKLYDKILEYGYQKNAYITNCRDIIDVWSSKAIYNI
ncbi:MAG: polysaccharide deacetylase family protein [Methanotrichaceae archaeon]|nr:polysaccharide deacetylase family protein [Methanotrichaceae archaeon]